MTSATVVVEHSDTAGMPFGYGTYGSRSLAVGGTARYKSVAKIKEKTKKSPRICSKPTPTTSSMPIAKGSPDQSEKLGELVLQAAAHSGEPLCRAGTTITNKEPI